VRCAIYVRVSREEQIEGWSLDAQLEQCRALAALRHWQIAHVYEEPGRSAKTDLRPCGGQKIDQALIWPSSSSPIVVM